MKVIIVGGGNTGAYLAKMLIESNHDVTLIENRPQVLEKLGGEIPHKIILVGDGSLPAILEQAGIRQTQVLAAVTGDDETNLVISSLARFEFNVPRIIGRVNNPKNAWLFTPEMGMDVSLNQADILAHLVAEEMSMGDMMTLLKLRKGEYSLIEEKVHPDSVVVNCAVKDMKIPQECSLVAVIRKNQLIIPRGDTVLESLDEVLALVHQSRLYEFNALLGSQNPLEHRK